MVYLLNLNNAYGNVQYFVFLVINVDLSLVISFPLNERIIRDWADLIHWFYLAPKAVSLNSFYMYGTGVVFIGRSNSENNNLIEH